MLFSKSHRFIYLSPWHLPRIPYSVSNTNLFLYSIYSHIHKIRNKLVIIRFFFRPHRSTPCCLTSGHAMKAFLSHVQACWPYKRQSHLFSHPYTILLYTWIKEIATLTPYYISAIVSPISRYKWFWKYRCVCNWLYYRTPIHSGFPFRLLESARSSSDISTLDQDIVNPSYRSL